MLTKITIRNFKRFEDVEVPLGNGIVFIGPNNSGKTSALQALALWHAGLQEWMSKRRTGSDSGDIPIQRPGVTVNRKNLVLVPTPHSNMLWHKRKVIQTDNVRRRIELTVYGSGASGEWKCGLEFDYANPETFHCRPLRLGGNDKNRMPIPVEAPEINLALLPPMSGLAAEEPLIQSGRINVLLGQGRTAEVLRNLCYTVAEKNEEKWGVIVEQVKLLFGIALNKPVFRPPTGDIEINYKEGDTTLDLQGAGRGVQQVILLLAFLYYHKPGTVLLLDEPDAHLEILRQEEIYKLLSDTASTERSQIIAASHSEKLLNAAATDNTVVAFVGKPHLLAKGKEKEVRKALNSIGWEHYFQVEILGWILYLEGNTDRKILSAFADKLQHPAKDVLSKAWCKYIGTDRPTAERKHFTGLKEAKPDLIGVLLMDNKPVGESPADLTEIGWEKREIENYICTRETLLNYAGSHLKQTESGSENSQSAINFSFREKDYHRIMDDEITQTQKALKRVGDPDLFDDESKGSKRLETLMRQFSDAADVPLLTKKDFYKLVEFVPDNLIDPEIKEKLDAIEGVSKKANLRIE